MDTRQQQLSALISNIALVQAQAIVVASAASVLTVCTTIVEGQSFVLKHFVSLSLTAILTASTASFILSTTMVILAIVCRKCQMNPDNICTPIAAMLGRQNYQVTKLSNHKITEITSTQKFYYCFFDFSL